MIRMEAERLKQGLTLQDLADEAELALNTVWKISCGRTVGSRLSRAKIAMALGIPVEECDSLIDEVE